jgi:ribonuclease P protein component
LAVERNKIKRWVKEIFRKKSLNQGFVVVIKRGFLEKGFRNNYDAFNLGLENFIGKRQDG